MPKGWFNGIRCGFALHVLCSSPTADLPGAHVYLGVISVPGVIVLSIKIPRGRPHHKNNNTNKDKGAEVSNKLTH